MNTADEVQDGLEQVMAAYRNLPTDQLISDTVILTSDDGMDALRRAGAATLGYSRGSYYLDTARSLMRQIIEDAHEISWRMDAYNAIFSDLEADGCRTETTGKRIEKAVKERLGAQYLSLHAEILWHFYSVSLQHAWHFMENCAKAVDPTFAFTGNEEHYLTIIQAFRNHMEHRDKAARSTRSKDWQSMSREEKDAFQLGYRRDWQNNIFFIPATGPLQGQEQQMPVNPAGFQRFETLLIAAYERLKCACIRKLEQYFANHPDELPPLDQIGKTLTDHFNPIA